MKSSKSAFKQRVKRYYHNKLNSCRSRKIPFNLTLAQVTELMSIEYCAYTGLKMTQTGSDNNRLPTDLTLERVDCEKGYTVENIIAVCLAANSVKAVLETSFRSSANDVIHSISATLRRLEDNKKPVGHNKVQKTVLWINKLVGL